MGSVGAHVAAVESMGAHVAPVKSSKAYATPTLHRSSCEMY